jgi:hypothetical protein
MVQASQPHRRKLMQVTSSTSRNESTTRLVADPSKFLQKFAKRMHAKASGLKRRLMLRSALMFVSLSDGDLPSLWTVLSSHLADLSSPLYKGLLTSFIDPHAMILIVDPSGTTQPASPPNPTDPFVYVASADDAAAAGTAENGKAAVSTSIVILLAVIGGVALILVVIGVSEQGRDMSFAAVVEAPQPSLSFCSHLYAALWF